MDFWGIVIYALLVFYFLLVIATVFTVLHERRDPVRALSWIAVIVLLPFAGMVLFVFFGQDYRKQKIFNRKEIKDLLAYIRLVINPRDDEAFLRIINTPSRGIGDVTVSRIADAAARKGLSLWEAASELTPEEMELKGAASKRLTDFVAVINDLASMRAVSQAHELALEIASRSGIIGMYKIQQTPEAVSALENIEELINSVRAFSEEQAQIEMEEEGTTSGTTLEEWLQNVALLTDMDNEKPEDRNRVTLMTVHGAKGLEFDCVYVAGLEENLFPSLMSMVGGESVSESDESRLTGGAGRGATALLRGAHPGQTGCSTLLCRIAVQMGGDDLLSSEPFSRGDRSAVPRHPIRSGRTRHCRETGLIRESAKYVSTRSVWICTESGNRKARYPSRQRTKPLFPSELQHPEDRSRDTFPERRPSSDNRHRVESGHCHKPYDYQLHNPDTPFRTTK